MQKCQHCKTFPGPFTGSFSNACVSSSRNPDCGEEQRPPPRMCDNEHAASRQVRARARVHRSCAVAVHCDRCAGKYLSSRSWRPLSHVLALGHAGAFVRFSACPRSCSRGDPALGTRQITPPCVLVLLLFLLNTSTCAYGAQQCNTRARGSSSTRI